MSEECKAKPYSDLYDILGACTNEEIAPIVEVLVGSPISVLKISRAFELNAPDHHRYADAIGDEVYRLALAALGRNDGERPAYAAMLEGLCKKTGFLIIPEDISRNESNLLNTFASQHLLSVSATDRQRVVDGACVAASRAASGMLSSDAWPPFASALLHLAYLRRKLTEDGRLVSSSRSSTTGVQALTGDDAQVLVVRVEGDEPVLSLATIPSHTSDWQTLVPNGKVSSVLYPVLQAIQPLVAGSQMLRNDTLWQVAEKGTAHIVQGGYQRMRNLAPISAAGLMGPIALMALASAMVEQHKLEQIEKSLAEIKASLQDVSKFQKGERRSVLTGSIRYFQQIAFSVLAGELAEEVLHELERHEVELVRVQDHLTEEARGQIAALRATKKDSWGTSKYVKALQEDLATLDKTYDELFLCIRARACAYMLLCAFPGREAGKRARLDDIRSALDTFSASGEATVALDQGLREKLQAVSSFETKGTLLSQENALMDRVSAGSAAIIQGLQSGARQAVAETGSLSFDIKLQDGLPVAVRMADPMRSSALAG